MALFQAYATATQPFKTVIENTHLPNAFSTMAKLDQEKTCHLHYAADMVRGLTDGLMKMEQVYACRGFVTAASLAEKVLSQHQIATYRAENANNDVIARDRRSPQKINGPLPSNAMIQRKSSTSKPPA